MPFPLNRAGAEPQYYTWRDTAIEGRSAPNSMGSPPLSWYFNYNVTLPPTPADNVFSPDNVPSIGLPLLMEFRCYPTDGGIGNNRFDMAQPAILVNNTKPYFRAFSAGGIDQNGDQQPVQPDTEGTANGGYDATAAGAQTPGLDNTFYIGALDLVTRVSRSYSLWFSVVDPKTDGVFTGAKFAAPVMEPRLDQQPRGTAIQVAFRGAAPGTTGPALVNARVLDGYGDHYPVTEPPPEFPNFDAAVANPNITFQGGDTSWTTYDPSVPAGPNGVLGIDGAVFYQMRVTFIANAQSGLTPELSSLAVTWSD